MLCVSLFGDFVLCHNYSHAFWINASILCLMHVWLTYYSPKLCWHIPPWLIYHSENLVWCTFTWEWLLYYLLRKYIQSGTRVAGFIRNPTSPPPPPPPPPPHPPPPPPPPHPPNKPPTQQQKTKHKQKKKINITKTKKHIHKKKP